MPQTTASIIADSISPCGYRITTFEAYYPRYLLAEVNTHRMIARSSASSRAIPVAKRIEQVRNDPFVPSVFGKNKPGMQSTELIDPEANALARELWLKGARDAAELASQLDKLGVHKQQANRILEPYVYVHTVMTGTEWENYFTLRAHAEADPEFEVLATMMKGMYEGSSPVPLDEGQWHLPYLSQAERSSDLIDDLKVSAARCARVSYRTQDGFRSQRDADRTLAARLLASGHLSPFDHQGVALGANTLLDDLYERQRHLVGWVPYRVFVEEQAGLKCRRFFNP